MVDRVDALQRRRRALSIPIGVVYKFFDDQGGYLAAIVTYYAFIAIFPILLIASSVLGFLIQGDAELRNTILDSALGQFPIVGTQLGRPEGLTGSVTAVVVGTLAALYGALGLGQAIQNVMNTAWAVPRNSRLNPFLMRLRSLLLLLVAGLAVLGISIFSALGSYTDVFGPAANAAIRWSIVVGTVLIVAGVLTLLFRLAASRSHSPKRSPIMIDGRFVLARGTLGIIDASARRSPVTPWTLPYWSQTASSSASGPMGAVPQG